MQIKSAQFYSLDWKVSDVIYSRDTTPPKNALKNRKSKEYVKGSDGSFVTRAPNKLILTVKSDDGNLYSQDIISFFKDVFPRKNVTSKVRRTLEDSFKTFPFEVRIIKGEGYIFGLYDAIRKAFN